MDSYEILRQGLLTDERVEEYVVNGSFGNMTLSVQPFLQVDIQPEGDGYSSSDNDAPWKIYLEREQLGPFDTLKDVAKYMNENWQRLSAEDEIQVDARLDNLPGSVVSDFFASINFPMNVWLFTRRRSWCVAQMEEASDEEE